MPEKLRNQHKDGKYNYNYNMEFQNYTSEVYYDYIGNSMNQGNQPPYNQFYDEYNDQQYDEPYDQ